MRGTIKNIVLSPAANDKMTPWIDVALDQTTVVAQLMSVTAVRMCASDSNLKMMRVTTVV